jgi:AcrR family transcriptional regulator
MMGKKASKNPRGRPREFNEEEALDAATRVFANKGYDAASLSDLTAAMGINRVSMYSTFGNKEALFCKAMERFTQETRKHLAACMATTTAREAIEKLLHEGVKRVTSPDSPGVCFVTQAPLTAPTDETRRFVARKRAEMERALRRRFDLAIEEGELPRNVSSEDLARFYSVIVQGLALQAQHGGTAEQLLRVVNVAIEQWPGKVPSADLE